MSRTRFTSTLLFFALALALCLNTSSVRAGELLRFLAPASTDSAGVSKNRINDTLKKLFEVLKVKTGIEVQLAPLPGFAEAYGKKVFDMKFTVDTQVQLLKQNKVELVFLSPEDWAAHPDLKALSIPRQTWTVVGQKYGKECIYVSPKSGLKTLKELKGKTFNNPRDYLTIRMIMAKNGVDMPLNKFFSGFAFEGDAEKGAQMLLAGKVDAVHINHMMFYFLKNMNPALSKLTPVACLDNMPFYHIAARRQGVNQALLDRLDQVLGLAHKDPSFTAIKWFFLAFKGNFIKIGPEYFAGYQKMVDEAAKKGWVKESHTWRNQVAQPLYAKWRVTQ